MVLLYLKRILLSLLIVPLLFSCNNVTETTKATTDTTKTKVTTNKALANNITELGVTVLPTVDGILDDSEVNNFVYPAKDTVYADSMNSQIAAYGTAYKVWIGPKSWTGKGESGADGNTVASLYPQLSRLSLIQRHMYPIARYPLAGVVCCLLRRLISLVR